MSSPNKINLRGPLYGIGGLTLLALGFILADALLAIAPSTANAADIKIGVAIVNKWQSLLGALFTPLVAALSVWMVLRQIQENAIQEDAKLQRLWRAQRSLMPIVMSCVCAYAERSAVKTKEAFKIALAETVVVGSRLEPPTEIDELSVDRMVAMIEVARSHEEVEAFAELLTRIQVRAARWRGFCGVDGVTPERRFPEMLDEDLVDAAEIYAMASNLLTMARPERYAPGPPMSRQSGLLSVGVRDFDAPSVAIAAQRDEAFPLAYPAPPVQRGRLQRLAAIGLKAFTFLTSHVASLRDRMRRRFSQDPSQALERQEAPSVSDAA
jgi:hypothetical protein